MRYKRFETEDVSRILGMSIEDIYNMRIAGATWEYIAADKMSQSTLKRIVGNWAKERGFKLPSRNTMKSSELITNKRFVDKGMVMALYRGRWKLKDIALECRCTEEVAKEVIEECLS